MITIDPQSLFRKMNPEAAAEHSAWASSLRSQMILQTCLSWMASAKDVSPEELRGAKIYMNLLLNIAESPAEMPKPLPDKSLGQKPKQEKK